MLRMVIPSDFYKYIIGWKGGTKSSIEKDTKTRIRVPQRGTEGDIGELGVYLSSFPSQFFL